MLTGWRGVPVVGLEDGASFFAMLARREFPVGNFIRDERDLSYTPAPDVFHDLYGHLPLLADAAYADFCWRFGVSAMRFGDTPERLLAYERLFWFGVEFPLIESAEGRRIFGGGILSSSGESDYALGPEPEVLPFDLGIIRRQAYRIDLMQTRLFVLDRPETLYGCLPAFEQGFTDA
jgi:phenylalanine-4-hydroxylase